MPSTRFNIRVFSYLKCSIATVAALLMFAACSEDKSPPDDDSSSSSKAERQACTASEPWKICAAHVADSFGASDEARARIMNCALTESLSADPDTDAMLRATLKAQCGN